MGERRERTREKKRKKERQRSREGGGRGRRDGWSASERGIARLTGAQASYVVLRLAFKIRNRRREAGEVLMTLAGPGPRWRNAKGKWKSVEGGAHRRRYRPTLRTCPTPLSLTTPPRRHPPPATLFSTPPSPPPPLPPSSSLLPSPVLPHYHTVPSCLPFATLSLSRTPARARASV